MLNDNQKLKEDLSQSKTENQVLKTKVESQLTNISGFQNQMKMSKLVNNMAVGRDDSGVLKEKLDGYIKEIDKCISHLAE